MSQSSHDFLGTERFHIRRRLGSGGMGVVYEAHDRQTDKLVALKTLTRAEASHISRFKNEFRSLADVSHPNLVALYEFMVEGQYWFFTMELVKGVNFLEYVRPGYQSRRRQSSKTPTLLKGTQEGSPPELLADYEAETRQMDTIGATDPDEDSRERRGDSLLEKSKLDLRRLMVAMRQLAEGLHGLHEMGKLHRDIKPSNVLVTNEGRVVILDFGLVAQVEGKELHDSVTLAGTPDYMSPEQGAQLPISRASDWYSIGVMLYQALTGRLPFSGKFFEVMMNKQNFDPPAPREIVSTVPADLNDLCVRLLRRKPDERPEGREVLRILGHDKAGPLQRPIMSAPASSTAQAAAFVGRARQFRQLNEAFAFTRRDHTVTVYLHGSSGMGKTALARHFLDELRTHEPEVVILEGRCYERESVPYKALDGVVDSLTKYLLSLSDVKAEALMPREVLALARLFPVMLQVDAVFNAPQREHEMPDPFTLRRKAFAALRELLGRISDRQPLVLYIDDLQWSDADSTTLLEDLLRPPDSPPLMLLSSFRTEDLEAKPFLKTLLEKTGTDNCREVYVGALSKSESYEMLDHLLGPKAVALAQFADAMVSEARGNPFLLEQLARYALTSDQTATTGITLAMMLDARLSHLPKDARAFVDALAVAGRPINPEVVYQAAELSGDELQLIGSLRAAQFIRAGNGHTLELYHDRIRETLASQLSPAKVTQIHKRLAQGIEVRGIDDPEALFEHYLGAGERVRAAMHAAVAARKAASALAFDRAAAFYQRALELAPARDAELVDLKRGLAEALVNAGRPAQAAQAYLEVAQLTSARHSLEFKRRAAEQLLMGGHINEGLELIRSVLAAVGLSYPATPRRALISLLLRRLQIRLRGLKFKEREESQILESDLIRLDTCWAVAAGLGSADLIRGADFQSRHLLLALRAGEPFRVSRALAFEAIFAAARGGVGERSERIAKKAHEIAQRLDDPYIIGLSIFARGMIANLAGSWRNAYELCNKAAEIWRERCTGTTWEQAIANRYRLSALILLGELAEVSRQVPSLLSAALEQGNLFAAIDLRTRLNVIWLAADQPDKARAEVVEALKSWPQEGFHLQHYLSLHALVQIEIYTGDLEVACKHVEGQWQALENSQLFRTPGVALEAMQLRARATVAACAVRPDDSKLRLVEKMAGRMEKVNMSWSKPYATLLRAAVAQQRTDDDEATRLLSEAVQMFERAEMRLYAAAARRRLGEKLGGERGQQLIVEADAWMTGQKIQNPEALVKMLAPGF
ncbi:MAG: eukaryotic-like serine/threonine-protein kinase [Pyrinomonadaceae bacterium]|jgi:serine/threonine protein kinase/tetratricopeptide (TPR) repeat protein|nr:eukaryotic-like serine/threonine-protein kinase [Pyrinomonadaceae bacterium]